MIDLENVWIWTCAVVGAWTIGWQIGNLIRWAIRKVFYYEI